MNCNIQGKPFEKLSSIKEDRSPKVYVSRGMHYHCSSCRKEFRVWVEGEFDPIDPERIVPYTLDCECGGNADYAHWHKDIVLEKPFPINYGMQFFRWNSKQKKYIRYKYVGEHGIKSCEECYHECKLRESPDKCIQFVHKSDVRNCAHLIYDRLYDRHICASCHNQIDKDSKYCKHCGSRILFAVKTERTYIY